MINPYAKRPAAGITEARHDVDRDAEAQAAAEDFISLLPSPPSSPAQVPPKNPSSDIFIPSVFGIICRKCNQLIMERDGGTEVKTQKLLDHSRAKCHKGDFDRNFGWTELLDRLKKKVLDLQQQHEFYDTFLVARSKKNWYSCQQCAQIYTRRKNCLRHIKTKHAGNLDLHLLPCPTALTTYHNARIITSKIERKIKNNNRLESNWNGQAVDDATLDPSVNKLLPSIGDILPVIKAFVDQKNEDPYRFCPIFQHLIWKYKTKEAFATRMLAYLEVVSAKAPGDSILEDIEWAASKWILEDARLRTHDSNGKIRNTIMVLGEKTLQQNELTYNATFNMRHSTSKILEELIPLLRYLWRQDEFDLFAGLQVELEGLSPTINRRTYIYNAFVPSRIVYLALMEKQDNILDETCLGLFCKIRCFKKRAGSVVIKSSGECGSHAAAVMHITRLAFLSSMSYFSARRELMADDVNQRAEEVRGGVLNILGPCIRIYREISRNKPKELHSFIAPNGDIVVEDHVFKATDWKMLIPSLISFLENEILPHVFEGDDWKIVMDIQHSVRVKENSPVEWVFEVALTDTEKVSSSDLKAKSNVTELVKQMFSAFVEFCFLGLGLGASRHAEHFWMESFKTMFRNYDQCLLFYTRTAKVYSTRSTRDKALVEHKLSRKISRALLLFRWTRFDSNVYNDSSVEDNMLIPYPATAKRAFDMKAVGSRVFELEGWDSGFGDS